MYILVYITCTFPYAIYPSSGQDLLSLPRRRMLPNGSRSGAAWCSRYSGAASLRVSYILADPSDRAEATRRLDFAVSECGRPGAGQGRLCPDLVSQAAQLP